MPLLSVNLEILFDFSFLNGNLILVYLYLTSSPLNQFYSWDEGTVKNIIASEVKTSWQRSSKMTNNKNPAQSTITGYETPK